MCLHFFLLTYLCHRSDYDEMRDMRGEEKGCLEVIPKSLRYGSTVLMVILLSFSLTFLLHTHYNFAADDEYENVLLE